MKIGTAKALIREGGADIKSKAGLVGKKRQDPSQRHLAQQGFIAKAKAGFGFQPKPLDTTSFVKKPIFADQEEVGPRDIVQFPQSVDLTKTELLRNLNKASKAA